MEVEINKVTTYVNKIEKIKVKTASIAGILKKDDVIGFNIIFICWNNRVNQIIEIFDGLYLNIVSNATYYTY